MLNHQEINALKEGGRLLAKILHQLARQVRAGIKLQFLESQAYQLIKESGGQPAFLGFRGFPAVLCVSVNEEVVHGPGNRERVLQDGDIVSLDLGLRYYGLFTDAAVTVPVGRVSKKAAKLISVTKGALAVGVNHIRAGVTTQVLGKAIEDYVCRYGFQVVRDLVGHGVGRSIHEPPEIPNFYSPHHNAILQAGQVIAVEPMVVTGNWPIETLSDNWTVVTRDRSLAAHFEHTVLVTKEGNKVLTNP